MKSKSKKHIYVLGTGLSHDGSVCLLRDGKVCVAIEKERLTRTKHDGGNDSVAMEYCLNSEGIDFEDISLVVQNTNFGMFPGGNDWWLGPRLLNGTVPVVTISHHLAHAFSAVGTSPFRACDVLILDGCGSAYDDSLDVRGALIPETPKKGMEHLFFEKDSFYAYENERLTSVYKDYSPWGIGLKGHELYPLTTLHSIGGVYQAASTYVFGGMDDSGKLMGLAPYGKPGIFDFKIFDLRDGRVFVNYEWVKEFNAPARGFEDFKKRFVYFANFAFWIQTEVERAILYVVNSRFEISKSPRNLAYAGGVALNALANRRIIEQAKYKNVYIQPAAGDNGISLGCAYYGWLEVLKQSRTPQAPFTAFGRKYTTTQIESALTDAHDSLVVKKSRNILSETAALLAKGRIIGWFQDGAEFGPRALGHRSILCDPRMSECRNIINRTIKLREDFRPFAPAVRKEDLKDYFDLHWESPFMLTVAPVKDQWKHLLRNVVHENGLSRIQSVSKEVNPQFHKLLSEFKGVTGLPILLNTSFNRRGMPIVETPEEAIRFFLESNLDVLVMNDYVVKKGRLATV